MTVWGFVTYNLIFRKKFTPTPGHTLEVSKDSVSNRIEIWELNKFNNAPERLLFSIKDEGRIIIKQEEDGSVLVEVYSIQHQITDSDSISLERLIELFLEDGFTKEEFMQVYREIQKSIETEYKFDKRYDSFSDELL
ncbi:hypothetical protein TEU_03380 [Thermococcus eurythermalis]|uniref:Uncharacterized protein n=1 Tax=Thermococcus eurythermalis TaxID=1505907 RepID=A0A097QSK1_9EURY|nr:hypothetical protein [Thermococcus eurythermalis]AIU69463.1 hypothetical protein TEU_03380 [Thermococcus eurythermalis]